VRRPEEVKALADRVSADFGGTDILVNNAGVIMTRSSRS
jgi:NAD(P)-dependent dehydrogenase (short-subunit alcohol dehydrogenase family)